MPTRDEICDKVRSVLIEALAVDEDQVRPGRHWWGSAGTESIDFLDIAFRLEKARLYQIPRGELFPEDILIQRPKYVQDGKLTAAAIGGTARRRMPYANLEEFAKNPVSAGFCQLADRRGYLSVCRTETGYHFSSGL